MIIGAWLRPPGRGAASSAERRGRSAEQVKAGPVRRLYLVLAGLIVGLLVAAGAVALRQHDVAIQEAARNLRTLTRALASDIDRTFQAVDLVVADVVRLAEGIDPASFETGLGDADIHIWLRAAISALPQIDGVAIVNARGKVVNLSRHWPIPEIDVSDRDYFNALKAHAAPQSFIGAPVRNRATGTWTISLARRLNGPGGEFAGLVLGAIELGYFERAFRDIAEGDGLTMALVRDDHVLLARHPRTDEIGRAFAEFANPLAQTSFVRERSPIDGEQRIKVARALSHYPLLVRATLTEEKALGVWRQEMLILCAGLVALIVALLGTGRAFGRLWLQEAALARAEGDRRQVEAVLAGQREKLASIDALQAAKEEAERLQAAAEAANQAKSAFLAMMSHELRTPLNAVIGFAEVMSMEAFGKLGHDSYREYTSYILESGRHLLAVINDILDLSKAEADKIDLRLEPTNLAGLAAEVCRLMQREASAAGLALVATAGRGDPVLHADPQRLRQILLNLVSNAIKFTGEGGKITVGVSGNERGVTLSVEDTGIGIAPDRIADVFRPFVQIDDSLARKREGTGLGLPLVRAMARLHGGEVRLTSEIGRGTLVEVVLPRVPPGRAAQSRLPAAA